MSFFWSNIRLVIVSLFVSISIYMNIKNPALGKNHLASIKTKNQAEAEVVPSSSLVEDEVEVEVWG